MAEFTKITSADTQGKGVVGLPDTPGLTAGELQAKLDELSTEVIIPKFNNLVDELNEMDFDSDIKSEDITNLRLSKDKTIQVSNDGGETFEDTASSGHIIMNGAGASFTQRTRLQFSANTMVSDDSVNGVTFVSIPSGQKGDRGDAGTITIGSVTEGDYASVTNTGSQQNAILNFTLPKGDDGDAATIQVGTVSSGDNPSVSNRGTSSNAIFDFVLPKGPKGDVGQGINILGEYATVAELQSAHPTGNPGNAYMVGTSNPKDLYIWDTGTRTWANQGALQGVKGDTGEAGTIAIGTVTEGTQFKVENVGTSENAILNFELMRGADGQQGNAGTIAIGTVTAGDTPSITNVGTPSAAVLDFVVPKGDKGDRGEPTTVNGKSGDDITIYASDLYMVNYEKPDEASPITPADSIVEAIGKLERKTETIEVSADKVTYGSGNVAETLDEVTETIDKVKQLLTGTIPTGETSITITDSGITEDSIIDIYFKDKVLAPTKVTVTEGQIIVEIDAEETDTEIGIRVL